MNCVNGAHESIVLYELERITADTYTGCVHTAIHVMPRYKNEPISDGTLSGCVRMWSHVRQFDCTQFVPHIQMHACASCSFYSKHTTHTNNPYLLIRIFLFSTNM